ncbi:MAG: response regulator [Acidimicrobiia bacterium]
MGNRVTLVVADDTMLLRRGVVALLSAVGDFSVVGECDDLPSLLGAVELHRPDVVVTDICMPPTMTDEGVQAARRIRADHPHTGIVVLSQFAEPEFALALLENGSQRLGYLLKDRVAEPNELERAVRSVATGGSVVDPQIVDVLVQARTRRPSAVDRLTPRERDVMALVAQGYHNAAVAERLVVSEKAVAKHINSIFSKLDLGHDAESHHRVMAVLRWLSA